MGNPTEIISDHEIERGHGSANFGDISPRTVVNQGVLKTAFGYSHGSTAIEILHWHHLIRQDRKMGNQWVLTVKGQKYLRAVYGAHFSEMMRIGAHHA
ncbi:hypothetical protein [Paracoccus hibiscisoli]|uniref:Uncharacterized protein n=1 Tax=Paracoccus hibiscisoli TaxID=2023261 RepID=A0A4U0QUI2_9RHOB|nr:hypothetical protein [Paracoccus hibiscisoli]TJZ85793.1 hypothetical protein FA740_05175 [Paracoccus hibiscisoli]